MPRIAHAFALAAAALLFASPAIAQQPQPSRVCLGKASALAEQLRTQYGEALTAAGVDASGGLVQVYSNRESGSWTIAVTLAGGPTCIVSSGEGWAAERAPEPPKPKGQVS